MEKKPIHWKYEFPNKKGSVTEITDNKTPNLIFLGKIRIS